MKNVKPFYIFESDQFLVGLRENELLVQSIIDIFTDLSEDTRFSLTLRSARGFSYQVSDLLLGSKIENYDGFFLFRNNIYLR